METDNIYLKKLTNKKIKNPNIISFINCINCKIKNNSETLTCYICGNSLYPNGINNLIKESKLIQDEDDEDYIDEKEEEE